MARVARKISKTNVYHIILRGVNHRVIFEDDSDYELFLYILDFYKDTCMYEIFAYCLMSNHIHLLMKFPENNLSESMKKIEDKFVWWYNKKYNRCGHLFQDRFKSEPVECDRYLMTVFRYIHQNPIKAGIVQNVCEYNWSSYSNYQKQVNSLINTDFMIHLFDGRASLIKYVNEKNDDICMENIMVRMTDCEIIQLIKEANNYSSLDELQDAPPSVLKALFTLLISRGASIRQISRITGFSRKTVTKFCQ